MGGGLSRRLFLYAAVFLRWFFQGRQHNRPKLSGISHTVFACGSAPLGSISLPSQTAHRCSGQGERTT
jgi:hypothetical protein